MDCSTFRVRRDSPWTVKRRQLALQTLAGTYLPGGLSGTLPLRQASALLQRIDKVEYSVFPLRRIVLIRLANGVLKI